MELINKTDILHRQQDVRSHQPERIPGIIKVRPDTCDAVKTTLLPELATRSLYGIREEMTRGNGKEGSWDMYKNSEGYPDPTAAEAIRTADRPPENVVNFRRALKLMCTICRVRILGKVTIEDEKGRRW